jgi:hypothetical protein
MTDLPGGSYRDRHEPPRLSIGTISGARVSDYQTTKEERGNRGDIIRDQGNHEQHKQDVKARYRRRNRGEYRDTRIGAVSTCAPPLLLPRPWRRSALFELSSGLGLGQVQE